MNYYCKNYSTPYWTFFSFCPSLFIEWFPVLLLRLSVFSTLFTLSYPLFFYGFPPVSRGVTSRLGLVDPVGPHYEVPTLLLPRL